MTPITTVLRVVALAAAALLAGTLLAAPSASAEPSATGDAVTAERQARAGCNWQRKQCWGAVSFNKATGKSGTRLDTRTKAAAVKGALKKCRKREENAGVGSECVHPGKKKVFVRNGCVYVAMLKDSNGTIKDWAKGTAYNPHRARKRAMSKLGNNGTKSVSAYVCTTRHL